MNIKTTFVAVGTLALAQMAWAAGPSPAQPMPKPPQTPTGSSLLPAPKWAELSVAERDALTPLAKQFDSLEPQQRRKWRALAERARTWSPEKKQKIQSRMLLWANMSIEQRAAARQQALAAREASAPANRAESWKRWSELEDEVKTDLHGKSLQPEQANKP